ncbi:MAG: cysteine desulfurase NifS [Chitinivibrionales bacterium]|nr:cysteine desulfurase NifS [Chitinivibrionales bacterium]
MTKASNRTIYLDNNATTQVAPEVVEAMQPFFGDQYGNPSSIHRFGGTVRKHIDRARDQVAALIGADPAEILFTSCGTESDNIAIQGVRSHHGNQTRILTSTVEHPAVRNVCRRLRERGTEVHEIGVDGEGLLDLDQVRAQPLDKHTLLTFMWANNETGVIFPIEQLAEIAREHGCRLHTDAVQAVGKIPIDVGEVPIDYLALSGHKLHAPKGVGALYVRKGAPFEPLMFGGHQEDGRRPGTENVPYIVGLGVACDLARRTIEEENTRVRKMRDRLEAELLAHCPGAKRNGHPTRRLPNTANISFEFIEGEAILLLLDEEGVAASSGSACTTGSLEPSHVMRAMDIPYTLAHSSTRFSLSRYNTDEDIDTVVRAMPAIIERLRSISPYVAQAGERRK